LKDFVLYISKQFKLSYPRVLQHLKNIVEVEGCEEMKVSIKNILFTSFIRTKDYNYRLNRFYVDENDYNLGFII